MSLIPSGYVDDVLASNMNGKRQYQLIYNTNGTVSLEDVTVYTQEGSNFNAGILNSIIDNLNDVVSGFSSGTWTPVISGFSSTTTVTGKWSKIGKLLLVSFYCEGKATSGARIIIDGLKTAIADYNGKNSASEQINIDTSAKWYAGGGHLQGNKLNANNEFTGWIYDVSNEAIYGRNRQNVGTGSATASSSYENHNSSGNTEYMSGTIAIQLT